MPITTTSGYTFPVSGAPTTQTPNSGIGSTYPSNSINYGDWNGDWYSYLNFMAERGDQAALDKLLNYLMTEQSAMNARNWTSSREDSAYQRLVADMKAAGLNPYAFATLGTSPISSSSSGNNYSGSYGSSYEINKKKNELSDEQIEQNWLKIALSAMIPVFGAIIAAAL